MKEAILHSADLRATTVGGPSAAAVQAALADLPTVDLAALRGAGLAALTALFAADGAALLAAGPDGTWAPLETRGLPAAVTERWMPAPLPTSEPPGAALPVAALPAPLAAALHHAGFTAVALLGSAAADPADLAVLLFYVAPPERDADAWTLGRLFVQQLSARLTTLALRAQLHAQRTQLEAARAVSEISAALNSHLGEPDVLQLIADRAKELLVCDGVAINLLEPDGRSVRTLVVSGAQMAPLLNRVYGAERSAAARVTVTGAPQSWAVGTGTEFGRRDPGRARPPTDRPLRPDRLHRRAHDRDRPRLRRRGHAPAGAVRPPGRSGDH